jgi:hypothetical protein
MDTIYNFVSMSFLNEHNIHEKAFTLAKFIRTNYCLYSMPKEFYITEGVRGKQLYFTKDSTYEWFYNIEGIYISNRNYKKLIK